MKIRNRLSLQFSVIITIILLLLFSFLYVASKKYVENEFYSELYQRADITAQIYLEEDSISSELYESIINRYVRKIPNEIGVLFDIDNNIDFVDIPLFLPYDLNMVNYIRENYEYPDQFNFTDGSWQSTGFFYPDNQGDYVVIVSAIDKAGLNYLRNLAWLLVLGYLISIITLFQVTRFFSFKALQPISEILRQVKNINPNALEKRLSEGKEKDEINELVETFNLFLDRFEDSYTMQKRFIANASHELRTPLTSIIGEIEVALNKDRTTIEYKETLNSVLNEVINLQKLVLVLLDISVAEAEKLKLAFGPIRIDEIVIEACSIVEKNYPESKIHLNYENNSKSNLEDFMVNAYEPLLLNVFINLIENGVKFSPIEKSVYILIKNDETGIEIQIKDNGIGITVEESEKIFDPFYRSPDAMVYEGFGIGLSLVQKIIKMHDGEMHMQSELNKGTSFNIHFKKNDFNIIGE